MSKFGSQQATFLIDGYNFLAPKVQNVSLKVTSLTEQTDGLGDASQSFSPVGKLQLVLTQGGAFFDTAALSIHDAMAAKLGSTPNDTPRVVSVGIGTAIANICYGVSGIFSVAYEALLQLSKLTKANAEHLLQGAIERGLIICNLAPQTANFDTTASPVDYTLDPSQVVIPITSATKANPCVVTTTVPHLLTNGQKVLISGNSLAGPSINADNVATVISPTTFSVPVNTTASTGAGSGGSLVQSNTVNGASGYQQVTAFSGFTGYVGKLRHSADNVTYVDLITFANVTAAPNAQRVTAAGTVNRYVVYTGTVTGTGSISPFAMLARS